MIFILSSPLVGHQLLPGAIYSVVALLACVAPRMTFQLYGIIPIPAWLAVTGLFAYDMYSTLADKVSRRTHHISLFL